MTKLLIVDDEEIEREGIAQFVPWKEQGFEIIGTAWNGQDALDKMAVNCPDIVLADVKMPVMDGIELIRRCRCEYPDVLFVVLSGYGDYEFTSQAMAEGVRYYLLKPCGDEEILAVMRKAKNQLDEKRKERAQRQALNSQLNRAVPRAKSQFFRNLLLAREQAEDENLIPLGEYRIVALRMQGPFSRTQQLMIRDSFREIYGKENVPTVTAIDNDAVLLIRESVIQGLERLLQYFKEEWNKADILIEHAALSEKHDLSALHEAYRETQELFNMGKGLRTETLLQHSLFREKNSAAQLVNLKKLGQAQDYGELLWGIRCAFAKMNLSGFTQQEKQNVCYWTVKTLYGLEANEISPQNDDWKMILWFSELLLTHNPAVQRQLEQNARIKELFLGIYKDILNPELSLRILSAEGLFMNEDYLSRLFVKSIGMKFSAYLQQQRIRMATELMEYKPDIRIAQLAVLTGFAPDGQYFSKAFHKITGQSPRHYMEMLQKGRAEA